MRLNDWKLWTVLAAVLFLGGLGYYYFRPIVKEGVVAAKSITGESNNVAYTIIRFHELGVNPNIDDWESLFPIIYKILLLNLSNPSVESPIQVELEFDDYDKAIEFLGKCNASDIKFEKIRSTKLSDYVENQLKTRYTDLRYVINVRTKKTMDYYASKDDFNKVEPGDAVKFKILRKRDPTIKIIKVTRESHHPEDVSGVALISRGPNGSESRLPEYIPGLIILIAGFSGLLLFCYRVLNALLPTTDERR